MLYRERLVSVKFVICVSSGNVGALWKCVCSVERWDDAHATSLRPRLADSIGPLCHAAGRLSLHHFPTFIEVFINSTIGAHSNWSINTKLLFNGSNMCSWFTLLFNQSIPHVFLYETTSTHNLFREISTTKRKYNSNYTDVTVINDLINHY